MRSQQQRMNQLSMDLSSKKNSLENLPSIPDKLYFSIGEVSRLCLVKPHVLRYWEQEFPDLSPAKRRGKRRYYQRHDILLIRRIKDLLYGQGFTIEGAKSKLSKKSESDLKAGDGSKFLNEIISDLRKVLEELK